MNSTLTPEIREISEALHYRPAISIIMPFEPKMVSKNELTHSLKLALDRVNEQLRENYPNKISALVMSKLKSIVKELNFNTHKKSVAIYVSPVFEKVLYLDITVEQKIIIDESFEIRDLVYSKKQLRKYLVLLLSGKECRILLGNTNSLVRIISDSPDPAYITDPPEKVANFSDPSARKDILLEKFLHHIEKSLDLILSSYHLPLFVMGTERIMGHFKKLTKYGSAVIEYIPGNYEEATVEKLRKTLEPYLLNWKNIRDKDLLNQLHEAADNKKLAFGMKSVWQEAMNHKGKLLVVEKNFMYAAEQGSTGDIIYKATEPYNKFSYIKDAVDDVIEKVLANGGDVEFVDENILTPFQHIALVKYY